MASSEVEICNLGLARIGHTKFISSLDDSTPEGRVSKNLYTQARDATLGAAQWPFAQKRADLSELSLTRDGWAFVYAMPVDCLVAREIWSGNRNARRDELVPYAIEYDPSAKNIILSDVEDASLIYTARIENVFLYPPHFIEALAWRLGGDFALALALRPDVESLARARYRIAIEYAMATALSEGVPDVEPDSEIISVRGA